MTNYHIQIISDTVCPWCYIGYARLLRSIATHHTTHPTDTFSLSWKAFYLNPNAAGYPGVNKKEYYHSRFGAARTESMWARLVEVGNAEGVQFKFGEDARTGNTRDSHRLIWYAGQKQQAQQSSQHAGIQQQQQPQGKSEGGHDGLDFGLQTRVVEALFKAYFSQEKNITDRQVLIEAGVGAGVGSREELDNFLNTNTGTKDADGEDVGQDDKGGDEVDEEALQARRKYNVSGVPYFMIQGRFGIEGADEPETFLEVFEQVKVLEKREQQLREQQGGQN